MTPYIRVYFACTTQDRLQVRHATEQKTIYRLGEFMLKSGRISPYFFNAGLFNSGHALAELGSCYAQSIIDEKIDYDVLFGPAYKGIPLVSAIVFALSVNHGIDKPYVFNRKEKKATVKAV